MIRAILPALPTPSPASDPPSSSTPENKSLAPGRGYFSKPATKCLAPGRRPVFRGSTVILVLPILLAALLLGASPTLAANQPSAAEITPGHFPADRWDEADEDGAADATSTVPPLLAPLSDGSSPPLPDGSRLATSLPHPAEILGYSLGHRFTHHGRILDYLEALDAASGRVSLWSYGNSYEGRPLVLLAVSSEGNLARLEDIRRGNLALAGTLVGQGELSEGERRRLLEEQPVLVWLGYGVHGNESSSSEAALATAYLLAADPAWEEALERVVVLIDPLSNPDGRERYLHAYEQRRGLEPDPDPQAREHREPWPGGRQNHYLFDLNRDWAWATQRETRHRLQAYRRWEPQVHVDLHEMSPRSTYFFPPAAEPVHPLIPPRSLDWLDTFGRGNAEAFDRRGWVYYKAESFDLFYPGYGDSYPTLRGAVGMTYEMAGGGRAGQVLRLPDGRLLTLADRVARHLTASLATVETAASDHRRLLEDFVIARREAGSGEPTSFLWPAGQPEAAALADLLHLHGVQVLRLGRDAELEVRPATRADSPSSRRDFKAGDFVVSTRQPLGRLVRALLGPAAEMPEEFLERQRRRVEEGLRAQFYDITAWSLPLAFDLEAWRSEGEPDRLRVHLPGTPRGGLENDLSGAAPVGYMVPPTGLATYRLAAGLQRRGVRYRLLLASSELEGRSFGAGSLFVPRRSNPEELEAVLRELAADAGLTVRAVGTSYHQGGVSLGSDRVLPVRSVEVGLFAGEGLDPTAVGSLWHLLDRTVELPLTLLEIERLEGLDLSGFDTLIFPGGHYELAEEAVEALDAWVRAGGTLVAVEGAVEVLREHELTSVESWQPEDGAPAPASPDPEAPATAGETEEPDDDELTQRGKAGQRGETVQRRGADLAQEPLYTPGAVFRTELRSSHPLAAGLGSPPPALVRGSTVLLATGEPLQDLWTVAAEDPLLAGFAWPEAQERLAGSLLMGVEGRGAGRVVVLAQDPAFRGFWRATMPLFLNAVMYGPSLSDGGRY